MFTDKEKEKKKEKDKRKVKDNENEKGNESEKEKEKKKVNENEKEKVNESDGENENIDVSSDESLELKRPRLVCSARLLITFACLVAVFNVSYIRIGISMAMVCMSMPSSTHPESGNKMGEFNWSSSTKGYLTSAAFYGFIIGPSVAGFLSFKYGGKIILVLGTIITGISNCFIPEGTRLTPILFFIIRVFSGLCASSIFPAFYDLMSHWVVPEERQLLVGGALVGIPVASILNFPIDTFICNVLGWVWIFYLLSIWLTACGLIFIFIVYNYPDKCPFIRPKELTFLQNRIPKPIKVEVPWKHIIKSLPVYAYIVIHFCINYVFLSMILSLPLLMEDVYKLSLEENGMLSATPFMGSFIVRILISLFFENLREKLKLSKNTLRKIFILVGATCISVLFLIITFLSCWYWALCCFIAVSCSLELCITGGYLLSLLDLCPSYVNIISGIANSIGNTAGLICPVVNGWITEHGTKAEWNIVFYVNITVLIGSVIFYMIFGQNHIQYWNFASVPTQSSHQSQARPSTILSQPRPSVIN